MKPRLSAKVRAVLEASGRRPLVVATLSGGTIVKDAVIAARLGADLLELRVDALPARYHEPLALQSLTARLKRASPLPLIITIRTPTEQDVIPTGGAKTARLSTAVRRTLFEAVLPQSDFLDLEVKAHALHQHLIPVAHHRGKGILLSYHTLRRMPPIPELTRMARRAQAAGADLVKIAAFARTNAEVARLLEFCAHSPVRPLVVIALGTVGMISRVAGFLFGSCLTYGFVRRPAARGQIPLPELRATLRRFFASGDA